MALSHQDRCRVACGRRQLVLGSMGAAAGLSIGSRGVSAQASGAPSKGDVLVRDGAGGPREPLRADDLEMLARPVAALPADAASGAPRSGSRLNKLLLVRLDAADLPDDVRVHAADGVLAYSAICTHQGCTISAWDPAQRVVACFCHNSRFSTVEAGRVLDGPATRRLPILPLVLGDQGVLLVADGFTARPGFKA